MILLPPARIGIIGGGQLGMLITIAAKKYGHKVTILDPVSDCPAGQLADHLIVASFSDFDAFNKLAQKCDVITYEFEHIDVELLMKLESSGHRVYPSAKCLSLINDKYKQKKLFEDAGLPIPLFLPVDEMGFSECINRLGLPLVFKFRCGGYDGKGNIVCRTKEGALETWEALSSQNAMAEQYIHYERELSVILAKDLAGNIAFYPVVENYHEDGILRMTRAPSILSDITQKKILEISKSIMSLLDSPGVFCIEMFLDKQQNIFINEVAPRPHNSGHHTLDANITSQYEQLVRIITGMPLGDTEQESPCVMLNILGDSNVEGKYRVDGTQDILGVGNAHLYLYGKSTTKHLRKLGHITVLDKTIEEAEIRAKSVIKKIKLLKEEQDSFVLRKYFLMKG